MVRSSFISKLVEFDQFKTGIVQLFPETQKFNGAPASQPILDNVRGRVAVSVFCNICERDIIPLFSGNNGDSFALNINLYSHCYLSCTLSKPLEFDGFRLSLDWPLSALADLDHFGDVNEMILEAMSTVNRE